MPNRILLKAFRTELIEKHSRFIGIGYPCQSLDSFKRFKADLEKEFPDATHITFAYKFFENDQLQQRFSDDGEPSGTAGKPILMHIDGQSLINIAIFVVRYYGGIKLGAGGLVRAYGNTAKQVITDGEIVDYIPQCELRLHLPYAEQNRLEYLCKKHQATILDREFAADLIVRITLPEPEKAGFLDTFSPFLLKD